MRKQLLMFLLLVCGPLISMAADINVITLWMTDGSKVNYYLDEQPVMAPCQPDADVWTLSTSTAEVTYQVNAVKKLTFDAEGKTPTSIQNVQVADGQMQLSEGSMQFIGFQPGERITIYDASGAVCNVYTVNQEGMLDINLDNGQQGLRIIKTNHQSFKFIKK